MLVSQDDAQGFRQMEAASIVAYFNPLHLCFDMSVCPVHL